MNRRPNIILLMTDEHRFDHVSWGSPARVATPNLDRLSEGTVFTNAITPCPLCQPARTALLTGRYPHQIGILSMSGDLSPQYPTYPKALQKAGYRTLAAGKMHWFQNWRWNIPRHQGHDLVAQNEAICEAFGWDELWEACGKGLLNYNNCHYVEHLKKHGLYEQLTDLQLSAEVQEETAGLGWPVYPSPLPEEHYVDRVIADQALEKLGRAAQNDQPFFLFCSFCGPHFPFDPPARYLDSEPYEESEDWPVGPRAQTEEQKRHVWRLRQSYRAMVRFVDDQVGRIFTRLEELGILEDTVIMFSADHGDLLYERGPVGKNYPYRPSSEIPLAIRDPRHLSHSRNETPVNLIDLTASILDLAGVDPKEALSKPWPQHNNRIPARSLIPIVKGTTDRVREFTYGEHHEWELGWRMIRSDRYTYARYIPSEGPHDEPLYVECVLGDRLECKDYAPIEELFDLETDPKETTNLAGDPAYAEVLEWHRNRLNYEVDTTPAGQTGWLPYIHESQKY
jgi:arylsulfatase